MGIKLVEQYEKINSRPTWVEVNLSAIQNNIVKLKKNLNKDTKILAVVKANAYGHGMVKVSRSISTMVDYLGVATVDEGIEIRRNGIDLPVLIMSAVLPDETKHIVENNLSMTVFDRNVAIKLNDEAKKAKKKVPVHIKVDTGMGRIGLWYKYAKDFVVEIKGMPNLEIEGIYTHFPSAEEDEKFTFKQIERFNKLLKELESLNIDIPLKHAFNSAAAVKFKQMNFNLIRSGLMIYGVYPHANIKEYIKLEPALSFKSRLTFIKKVAKGRSISYGRTFITKKETVIGTIPVGYGDGYPHILSNRAKVLVRGKFVPIVGRICMDQLMVNLDALPEVKIGDEVIFIGRQKSAKIEVEKIAKLANTIPYEMLCLINSRVSRIYK